MKYSVLSPLEQWNLLAQDYLELLKILTENKSEDLKELQQVLKKACLLKKEMKSIVSCQELKIQESFKNQVEQFEQDFRRGYADLEGLETYIYKLFR